MTLFLQDFRRVVADAAKSAVRMYFAPLVWGWRAAVKMAGE